LLDSRLAISSGSASIMSADINKSNIEDSSKTALRRRHCSCDLSLWDSPAWLLPAATMSTLLTVVFTFKISDKSRHSPDDTDRRCNETICRAESLGLLLHRNPEAGSVSRVSCRCARHLPSSAPAVSVAGLLVLCRRPGRAASHWRDADAPHAAPRSRPY